MIIFSPSSNGYTYIRQNNRPYNINPVFHVQGQIALAQLNSGTPQPVMQFLDVIPDITGLITLQNAIVQFYFNSINSAAMNVAWGSITLQGNSEVDVYLQVNGANINANGPLSTLDKWWCNSQANCNVTASRTTPFMYFSLDWYTRSMFYTAPGVSSFNVMTFHCSSGSTIAFGSPMQVTTVNTDSTVTFSSITPAATLTIETYTNNGPFYLNGNGTTIITNSWNKPTTDWVYIGYPHRLELAENSTTTYEGHWSIDNGASE